MREQYRMNRVKRFVPRARLGKNAAVYIITEIIRMMKMNRLSSSPRQKGTVRVWKRLKVNRALETGGALTSSSSFCFKRCSSVNLVALRLRKR